MSDASRADFRFTKLVVGDLESASSFYTSVCGLEEAARVEEEIAGRPIREILFQPTCEGGATLVLLSFVDAPEPAPGELILGFTTSELDAFLVRVRKAGGAIAEQPRRMEELGIRVAFVTDPEGHLIEVVEPLAP